MLPISLLAQAACILEATARKPGNVHRYRDFEDLSYTDFLLSAAAIAPLMENAADRGVGMTILEAVRQTRLLVDTNANLGIILLLTPLAAVPSDERLEEGTKAVLNDLTVEDAKAAYEAIRLAQPGGLGEVAEHDVRDEPTITLKAAMRLAAERDSVARQYAEDYSDVFGTGVPALVEHFHANGRLEDAIIHCHLSLMAKCPDSLIARKRGWEDAEESSRLAADALHKKELRPLFDEWLRAVGSERNPGTTADLVAASLFAAFRDDRIPLPFRW